MSEIDGLSGCPVRFVCEFGEESRVLAQLLVNDGNDVVLVTALTTSSPSSALRAADLLNLLLASPIGYEQMLAGWEYFSQKLPSIDLDKFRAAAGRAIAGVWPLQRDQLPPDKGPVGRKDPHPGSGGRPTEFVTLRYSAVLEVFDEGRLIDAAAAAGWSPAPGETELTARAAGWIAKSLNPRTFPGASVRSSTSSSDPRSTSKADPDFSMSW